jgi:zinc transport system substrate-binding protein
MVAWVGIIILWAGAGAAEERLTVCVSILPQKYFVEKIGGDLVDVHVMVQPGESPATYEPKPRQMTDLVKTEIYFAIGVPFEDAWLPKISEVNPNLQVVHTDNGIEKIPMETSRRHGSGAEHDDADEEQESIDAADSHGHGGLDPHIWLSPALVKRQAQNILAAIGEKDPSHANVYEANLRNFISEIDALDARLKEMFSGLRQPARFMVFHPSWGYFARAYGLDQIPIEIEGKDPKPAQLKELIEHAREEEIRVIFVQPQFSAKSAELIAREIGGRVAVADPLAEDWAGNLLNVAEVFRASLK